MCFPVICDGILPVGEKFPEYLRSNNGPRHHGRWDDVCDFNRRHRPVRGLGACSIDDGARIFECRGGPSNGGCHRRRLDCIGANRWYCRPHDHNVPGAPLYRDTCHDVHRARFGQYDHRWFTDHRISNLVQPQRHYPIWRIFDHDRCRHARCVRGGLSVPKISTGGTHALCHWW